MMFAEVLAPQRPPAPPTEYYQINLGGYDPLNLISIGNVQLNGYVGCVRGLKIGDYLVDLPSQVQETLVKGKLASPLFGTHLCTAN
jgi:hypothetical protein